MTTPPLSRCCSSKSIVEVQFCENQSAASNSEGMGKEAYVPIGASISAHVIFVAGSVGREKKKIISHVPFQKSAVVGTWARFRM